MPTSLPSQGREELNCSPPQRVPQGGKGSRSLLTLKSQQSTKPKSERDSQVQLAKKLWWVEGSQEGQPQTQKSKKKKKKVNLRITCQLLTGRGLGQLPVILLLSKTCFYVQAIAIELRGRCGHSFIQQAFTHILYPALNTTLCVE